MGGMSSLSLWEENELIKYSYIPVIMREGGYLVLRFSKICRRSKEMEAMIARYSEWVF